MNIGFVGLGHMGRPMAESLAQNGHDVLGYDAYTPALENFSGNKTQQLRDIAQHSQVIITMLPSGHELMSIYQQAFLKELSADVLLIDCSTIGPIISQQWHELPYATVDAPVSGGVIAAQNHQLTYMLGGQAPDVENAARLLNPISHKTIKTGGPGSGQMAKICNNMILANTMIAVSEAFLLAEKSGLDPKILYDVVHASSGNCWVIEKYLPVPHIIENVPANQDYIAGFSHQMMLKDLKLATLAAKHFHQEVPLTHEAQEIYQQCADLMGALDFSAIFQYLKNE